MSFSSGSEHCKGGRSDLPRETAHIMVFPNSERLEHILASMREDTSIDAPADALKFAKDIFRSRVPIKEPSAIRRLVAALTMQIEPNKAAYGERSGSAS